MSDKTKRIISIILMILPSIMLVMSAVMKLIGNEQVVTGMTKIGLGSYIKVLGVVELLSVALLLYPKTNKIGFLLLCSYLGGAMSIELAGGEPPMAAIFIAFLWISSYLGDKNMFIKAPKG